MPFRECRPEQFDVIIVGGRCAGAPLAVLLARAGAKVAVLEQATFPRDTLSTHVFHAPSLTFLDGLGLTDPIRMTGAPFVTDIRLRLDDLELTTPWPHRPDELGGLISVRRLLLDPILLEAAATAGAEVRMATRVTGLLRDGGRVSGVRTLHDGSERVLHARLVVGADGRNSTIGRLVGARKYNVAPGERFAYWAFFEDARPGPNPPLIFERWENRMLLGCPADSGLYQVIIVPDRRELPRFRRDLERSFIDYATSGKWVAPVLDGARRVGNLLGMLRWEGFFREASGPGWVLVGDAGHFKDPTPGQGIDDAFRQVQTLAPAIVRSLGKSDCDQDKALANWERWRDEDAAEHYWFATDLGKAGPIPVVLPELAKHLHAHGKIDHFIELLNHRATPSKVLTAPRVLSASGRLLVSRGCDRHALLRELGTLIAQDAHRHRLSRRPVYVNPGESLDAGATDVDL